MALNLKQELFCKLFASDVEFFGNGVQSYIKAYNIDLNKKGAYGAARANASELLTKANITSRINELFEAHGLNDTFVDKQLEKLIIQDSDFGVKLSAMKEYNAMKNRITKQVNATIKMPDPILGGISKQQNTTDDIIDKIIDE